LGNRLELERDVVIVACAVSAGIHAALTPEHFDEGFGAGAGFLAATVLLGGLALALLWQPASIAAMCAAGAVLAGTVPGGATSAAISLAESASWGCSAVSAGCSACVVPVGWPDGVSMVAFV